MRRKYVLMYDMDDEVYCIVRHTRTESGSIQSLAAIDEVMYDDVVEAAVECKQLNNLMGEKIEDAG